MTPKSKTYTLINSKFLLTSLLFLLLSLVSILCVFSGIKLFSIFFNASFKIKFFLVVFYFVLFYLLYRCVQFARLYLSYFWHYKSTRIVIDYQNETITTIKNGTTSIFNSDNLKGIEFHLSTTNYKNFLYDFGYTKLYSHDGKEIIITSLIVKYSSIENILNSVKKIKKLDEVIFLP